MWKFLLVLVLGAATAAGLAWRDYQGWLERPIGLSAEPVSFTLERGWSARRLGVELESRGLIDKRYWFDLYARLSGQAAGIKSGEYVLDRDLTVPELVDLFVAGETRQYALTLVEGTTFAQMRRRIARSEHLVQTLQDASDSDVMSALGEPELHPEGAFFADTYAFPKGTTDLEYLRRARRAMQRVLEQEWAGRSAALPLANAYEALILASIVEKETAVPAERPLIAQVFISRLNKGMRLQTDPTVIYGIGTEFDGNIRRRDLTSDTPYNTYTRAGLPPTPIALVGREALHAVLHPDPTSALYFVARGDGTHQFSDTLEQHNAAVREYQLKRRSAGGG